MIHPPVLATADYFLIPVRPFLTQRHNKAHISPALFSSASFFVLQRPNGDFISIPRLRKVEAAAGRRSREPEIRTEEKGRSDMVGVRDGE